WFIFIRMHVLICLYSVIMFSFVENAFVTQFRLILLDAYLAFGTTATITSFVAFRGQYKRPYSPLWWIFLSLTGIFLGFSVSCKWVGLFTIATVGLFTLIDLWNIF